MQQTMPSCWDDMKEHDTDAYRLKLSKWSQKRNEHYNFSDILVLALICVVHYGVLCGISCCSSRRVQSLAIACSVLSP